MDFIRALGALDVHEALYARAHVGLGLVEFGVALSKVLRPTLIRSLR